MSATTTSSVRRYRRRVVGLGATVFVLIFALGAAITIPRVQSDLEDRVEEELAAEQIDGVSASFSGQDGTLVCAQPLADADRAVRLSSDVRGVRTIDIDPTCLDELDGPDTSEPAASTSVEPDVDESTSTLSTIDDIDELESIVQILDEDPLFDQLSDLVDEFGLDDLDLLGARGPITLFAPTDEAFDLAYDTLGADTFGAMTSDRELVTSLLRQHIADGAITSESFGDGPIEMLDGSTLVIDPDGPTFSSAGSTVGVADPDTQLDIRASNGIVQAIDDILLPADFPLPSDTDPGPDAVPADDEAEAAGTQFEYRDGVLTLAGEVSDDDQRAQLRAAAETGVDPANIIDDFDVVDDAGPTTSDIDELAVVLEAAVVQLVSGQATLESGQLDVTGVAITDEGRDTVQQLTTELGATAELSTRPVADDESAMELQQDLNEYVRANPIAFELDSLDLTPESVPIVEQVAARALRLQGTDIVIVGYTDTAGSASSNQLYSEGRAAVVRDLFVMRGVPADSVTSAGFGENAPILGPDGTEDAAASRRIEFAVASR